MGANVRKDGDDSPMMDMNTTPLIDVMLVLLIMFIITIPVQTHAVKIDLPTPDPNPQNAVEPDKNKIFITASDAILWNGTPVDLAQLDVFLQQTKTLPVEPELQIEPEPFARYITVDRVIAVVKRSGVGKIGFVGNERYARVF
ncbi:MAG: biopolymer transporter ExbD [Sphingopyxis sp.]|nr:biopolymer transporter ExbD [Sphingopyxis sp.]